jgi:dolichol-phosphate mannosyltransferase
MSVIGILVALLGFFYAAIVFGGRLLIGNPVQGWAPLMIMILILGGLQLVTIGVIGEYLWRVLAQVRGREPYIIDAVYSDEIAES